jgi:hypothetical protein
MILVLDIRAWIYTLSKICLLLLVIMHFDIKLYPTSRLVVWVLALTTAWYLADQFLVMEHYEDVDKTDKKKKLEQVSKEQALKDINNLERESIAPAPVKSKKKRGDYGLSFMPPDQWKIPEERPPVCIQEKECPVCPIYLGQNDNLPYSVIKPEDDE